jgi:hypothetical protein
VLAALIFSLFLKAQLRTDVDVRGRLPACWMIIQRGVNSAQPLADLFSTRTGAVVAYSVVGDAPKIQPISAFDNGSPVAMANSAALSR